MENSKFLMGLIIFCLLFSGFGAISLAQEDVETIKLKAWTIGPDDPSITRKWNLELAAEQLNNSLAARDAPYRVDLEVSFNSTTWGDYKKGNLLALGSGDPKEIADIIVTGHEDIGTYADAGYIIPVGEFIDQYPATYEKFFESLWSSVEYKGKLWGVPQDTEARMFYYNKDLLEQAGVSESKINSIPERVEKGTFTLDDLVELGEKLIDSGVVGKTKAIWHRPTPGTDWLQFIYAHGGEVFDPETGQLVVDKSALLETLQFINKLVEKNLTPSAMSEVSWSEIHSLFAKERVVGIDLTGGSWNWAEWMADPYQVPESVLFDKIGLAPIPAAEEGGNPVSVSHPVTYLITKKTSSRERPELHQKLAFELITHASSVPLATDHALHSGHLALRKDQLDYWRYEQAEFEAMVSERASPHARFLPNHKDASLYLDLLMKSAIVPVETGEATPEEVVERFIRQAKNRIEDLKVIE